MLSMRIDSLVNALVRQELQGKGRDKQALHFHLDLQLAHYTEKGSFSERRGLHLLYHLKAGFTYISVFSAETDAITSIKEILPQTWKHEITHDSCWTTIGTFSNIYFDMAKKLNEQLRLAGIEEIAPVHMTEHNGFALFGPAFEWIPVEVTKDPTDQSNYRRLVTVVR